MTKTTTKAFSPAAAVRYLLPAWVAATVWLGAPGTALAARDDVVATINSNVNNFYPAAGTTGEDYNAGNLMFNGLVRITQDLKLEPELATAWKSNADASEWTFQLRRGVKFHNGADFTAADVVHTFKLLGDPALASRARSTADMIKTIETPDDYTVKFVLKEPYGAWPDMMIERQLKIVPASVPLAELRVKPVGTGPFMFDSYTPGDKLVLKKNPNYWEKGLPKLARVTLRIMPEDAAKIAALSSGDVDILWNVPLESLQEIKAKRAITVDSIPAGTWDGFVLNNQAKPFDDVRVRQAMLKAIDKRVLVQVALFGEGAPTHTPIPANHPYFARNIGFAPDVAGAKRLLAAAGYPNGFKITLSVPVGRPTRERAAVALQQMLKNVGITVALERVPYSRWGATIAGKAPFYMDGYLPRPTPDTATYPWYHSTGSWNQQMWHFSSPRIDQTLEAARRTPDPAQQRDLYIRFQEEALQEVPGVVMYSINFATAFRANLQGFHTHPYTWLDLRTAYFP
ncbi:ABC transporter substrate-binding protein [Xylophilus rhododendri]|uniref:ABC transporter substrate-binding protein n=1 Tax=Xylophilus rhododendri TaxID=2697032 RepID=A0A857J1L4_9BURK|nr:ABC transporter substrate-binding protein [Xylophilus rhododendri]QHI97814.1 ABC transporter substrate-binding protein [Xylophilus rhododendri]